MADRYWVGGAGTWNTTSTTNWSTSSGGASGASVPTAADSVIFDQAGTYTVTLTGALTCLDITVSAGTVTFAQGTSPTLAISGSMSLLAGTTWSASATITFNATTTGKTITTNGVTIQSQSTILNGVGGGWTLGSALTFRSNGSFTVTNGTFATGNYNLTGGTLSSSNSNTRTITLGSSTVSASIDFTITTNLTFNADTSQINTTNLNGGGLTFNNVNIAIALGGAVITGTNTFNTLNITGSDSGSGDSTGCTVLSIAANQTISSFTTSQVKFNARVCVYSDVIGTARTLTIASSTADYIDFRDITVAGAASPIAPSSAGNCGGNSGITFPAAKTVYWNLAGSQNWQSIGWATTSTGTPATANFPLAQDTAVFTNDGSAGTITLYGFNVGNVDMSSRTSSMTLDILGLAFSNYGQSTTAYGNWTNGTGVTLTTSATTQILNFISRTTQTITSNGVSFGNSPIQILGTGTVQLGDDLTLTAGKTLTLTSGTFNASNFNVTTGLFASNNSNTRTLTMGSGTWTLTNTAAATIWNLATTTGLTYTANTAPIVVSGASAANAITFAGGGLTYGNLSFTNSAATGTITFTGANTFGILSSSRTGAYTIVFPNVTTTVSGWSIGGSEGNLVTLARTGGSGTFTLNKSGAGIVNINYLSISNSTATPSTFTWYAGTNSTDGGGNTGWIFAIASSGSSNFILFF